MKGRLSTGLLTVILLVLAVGATAQPRLVISQDGSHLRNETDDAPFFYLADTAWELLHRCDLDETRTYLTDRANKGFNVIQCVYLAELEGLTTPNAMGDLPLEDLDPTRLNAAYLAHVKKVAAMADSLGVFLGLLPTWGDKFNRKWGVGPEVFTPANAETFARTLGENLASNNVIWILGGDRKPHDAEDYAIVRAMASGLRASVGKRQLITYHPQGGYTSSEFFAEDDWIDFHMFQSGHGRKDDKANYDFVRDTRRTAPDKPVINGEPAYEDHPVNWRPVNGWFNDFDARQAAWWSVLAGAAGHTFGNHNIWQMWQPGREAISRARTPWKTALHYPAAAQMGHLKALMETLPYPTMLTNHELFIDAPNSSGREVIALTGGKHLVAYTPYGDVLRMAKGNFPPGARSVWFDPRTGQEIPFNPVENGEELIFDPPFAADRGNDWVLVIR